MIRMEIACFMVLAFMAVLYFVAKREKTKIHNIFSSLLVISMIHLVFDSVSIQTVNNLENVPVLVNDIIHKIFIGTMIIIFYLVYRYIVAMFEDVLGENIKISRRSAYILLVALIGIVFLPIYYKVTEEGNYSYGPAAYVLYCSIVIYLFMIIKLMIKYWTHIYFTKKIAVTLAMTIEVFGSLYQAIRPVSLISGIGIMLINLSFYLLMENPDIRLVQQVKQEKEKADQANATKSVFLSNMSHEIRTPMNAIVGMTDVLLRTNIDMEQKEYLENIKTSGHALVAIINDILDISKIEAGKMELVENVYDIKKELDNIHMIINNRIGEKPIELKFDIDNDLPQYLYGDAIRLRQVVINLLNNAVKFTNAGYVRLYVNAELCDEDTVKLEFSVKDTGIGIKEADVEKLFWAFEQLDMKKNAGTEGTGLGLAISSQLVEMMGGKLSVKSEYGVGSEFYFTIYQKISSEQHYQRSEEIIKFIAPHAKVLVVDDDQMNRKVAMKLLEPLEMQIDVADSGKAALDKIEKNEYDIVFMDHMMPVMDGIETTRHIREKNDKYCLELPIIALTANVMKDAEKLFYEVGMNGILAKPIDTQKIEETIYKWLPKEKIIMKDKTSETHADEDLVIDTVIDGISVQDGIRSSGSVEMFYEMLGDFYILIDSKTNKIRKCINDDLIRDYTIEVHALKNTARLIGAMELSEEFARLEQYGNDKSIEEIKNNTETVLTLYNSYKEKLYPYVKKLNDDKKSVSLQEKKEIIQTIHRAIEDFDIDLADGAMEELETILLPEQCEILMEKLRVSMSDVAMEDILNITKEMLDILDVQ